MFKKLLIAGVGAAAALSMMPETAKASPLDIRGMGPIYFQFTNKEQIDIRVNDDGTPVNGFAPGPNGEKEGNWGVAQISILREGTVVNPGVIGNDIDSLGSPPVFSDQIFPTAGGQLTAMFYGIEQTSVSAVGTKIDLKSTNGYIDLYWDEPGLAGGGTATTIGAALPTVRTGWDTAGDYTDGILLARLAFASGIEPGDASVTIAGSIDTALVNGSGSADSYANIRDWNDAANSGNPDGVVDANDGLWAGILDTDFFLTAFGTRDLRFSNKIDLTSNWDGAPGIVGATSNDPGRAFAVPEPASLALFGAGLLGLGIAARRRRNKV